MIIDPRTHSGSGCMRGQVKGKGRGPDLDSRLVLRHGCVNVDIGCMSAGGEGGRGT